MCCILGDFTLILVNADTIYLNFWTDFEAIVGCFFVAGKLMKSGCDRRMMAEVIREFIIVAFHRKGMEGGKSQVLSSLYPHYCVNSLQH